jgi:predicted ATPase
VIQQLDAAVRSSPIPLARIAQHLGCDRATVYRWVDGTNRIPPRMLEKLGALLDLPRALQIAQFVGRGYPVPPSLLAPAHHLRATIGDFVGRDIEIAKIVAALQPTTVSHRGAICSVRGMAGVGKTELALAAAHALIGSYPDGQLVIELYGMRAQPLTSDQALQIIVRGLQPDVRLPETLDELQQCYRSMLYGKRMLIVADDARDAAQVEPLLPPAGCALLVTSRERLALPGQVSVDVAVLPLPVAEQLLQTICPRMGTDATMLAHLCGYLPLALRISASLLALMDTYPIDQYLTQLRDARLAYLRDPNAPDDPQRSVEASLQLSYGLLNVPLQAALSRLSVFPGDFDIDAATAILADIGDSALLLGQLRRYSLLEWQPERARMQLHDIVRVFAQERLADPDSIRERFAAYVADLVARGTAATQGAAWQVAWLDRLEQEYRNLEAALSWLAERDATVRALALATELGPFWMGRNHLQAGRTWIEMLLSRLPNKHERLRASALAQLGALARLQGDLVVARRAYEQSGALFQHLEEELPYAETLFQLGLVVSDQGEKLVARAYFEACLPFFRAHGQQRRIATVSSNIARMLLDSGEYAAAARAYGESYAIMRTAGDDDELGWLLVNLAHLASIFNDNDQALIHIDAAIALFQRLGHSQGLAWAFLRKGQVLVHQGDMATATPVLADAAARFDQLANPVGTAMAAFQTAIVAMAQEQWDDAWIAAALCRDEFAALQNWAGICLALDVFAQLWAAHDPAHALQLLGAGARLRMTTGVQRELAEQRAADGLCEALHARLGEQASAIAWALGQGLTKELALALARRPPPFA